MFWECALILKTCLTASQRFSSILYLINCYKLYALNCHLCIYSSAASERLKTWEHAKESEGQDDAPTFKIACWKDTAEGWTSVLISWSSPLQASLCASRFAAIKTLPEMSPSFTVDSVGVEFCLCLFVSFLSFWSNCCREHTFSCCPHRSINTSQWKGSNLALLSAWTSF